MSPGSMPVLVLAAIMSSPALYHGLVDQTIRLDQMAVRFLVADAIAWISLSVLAMLVGSTPVPPRPEPTREALPPG